jgi:hypothetical protein
MKRRFLQKNIIIILLSLCLERLSIAYSEPTNWLFKKKNDIDLITDFIAKRENYSAKCYKDGHGWSVGFGDFSLCNDSIRVLKWQYKHLKNKSDDYVRSLVRIDKAVAKWRLKKFVIECYDNLEKIIINGVSTVNILDSKEILALIDNMYTRGETKFYKDDLWVIHVINYAKNKQINCVKIAHAFLKQSQYSQKTQRNGVLARRLSELLDFTHRNCVYDVKFLITILNKYYTN